MKHIYKILALLDNVTDPKTAPALARQDLFTAIDTANKLEHLLAKALPADTRDIFDKPELNLQNHFDYVARSLSEDARKNSTEAPSRARFNELAAEARQKYEGMLLPKGDDTTRWCAAHDNVITLCLADMRLAQIVAATPEAPSKRTRKQDHKNARY